jgi:S-DNA-T family DNA segregation ATPase FtsK/SpoIIIE
MGRFFQKFSQDVAGIIYIGTAVFVTLALASFSPQDPSFNSIGTGLKVANYCGYVGSFLADFVYQMFGLAGWALPLGLFRIGYLSFQGQTRLLRNIRLVWGLLLLVTISSLMSVYWPQTKMFSEQIHIGGLLGLGISTLLQKAFNHVGVQILLWSMALLFLVFVSEKGVQELLKFPLMAWAKLKSLPWQKWIVGMFRPEQANAANKLKVKKAQIEELLEEAPKTAFIPLSPAPQLEIPLDDDQLRDEGTSFQSPKKRKIVMKTKVPSRVENWELPKISLLEDPPASRIRIDEKEIKKKAEILTQKLELFGVKGEVTAARPGPAVTLFEFKPNADVKLSAITALENDLSLALSSESLRILAPIPGRDVVGIETSNAQRETVYLKDIIATDEFWKDEFKLPIAIGKEVNGQPKIMDLRKMPHLMVAGTTGSGKSVFTVSMIIGFLFKHSPKTLRMILIDPKQVDLILFDKIPHLAMPVVTDPKAAVNSLKWAVREMEKRNRSMSKFGTRKLEEYNEAVSQLTKEQIEEHEKINQDLESVPGKKADTYYYQPLPYLVIVVEEFGDLMTTDKANVENSVVRLAQMARACGIHLLLALQSPRKEVVTGLIKTNIPGRISFKVNSGMDARIILDETGSERLLAQGDMLVKEPGKSSLVRHHGPFLTNEEINQIVKFWSDQAPPEYLTSALQAMETSNNPDGFVGDSDQGSDNDYDEQYDQIVSWISTRPKVSTTMIQQNFKLGYPRAARIMEILEREGVVGPANGSKPRQVLVNNLNQLVE